MRVSRKLKEAAAEGLTNEEKSDVAQFGEGSNPKARAIMNVLHAALYNWQTKDELPPTLRQGVRRHLDLAIHSLLVEFWDAFKTGHDASFFRDLADEIERRGKAVDPVRAFVGAQIEGARVLGLPIPTIKELKESETGRGLKVSNKTWGRAFSHFGIKQRGRPKNRK